MSESLQQAYDFLDESNDVYELLSSLSDYLFLRLLIFACLCIIVHVLRPHCASGLVRFLATFFFELHAGIGGVVPWCLNDVERGCA